MESQAGTPLEPQSLPVTCKCIDSAMFKLDIKPIALKIVGSVCISSRTLKSTNDCIIEHDVMNFLLPK